MTSTRPSPLFDRPRSFALTVCVCLVLVMVAPGTRPRRSLATPRRLPMHRA